MITQKIRFLYYQINLKYCLEQKLLLEIGSTSSPKMLLSFDCFRLIKVLVAPIKAMFPAESMNIRVEQAWLPPPQYSNGWGT